MALAPPVTGCTYPPILTKWLDHHIYNSGLGLELMATGKTGYRRVGRARSWPKWHPIPIIVHCFRQLLGL